jgi:DNA-binding SARP family transcriptional activator/predicted ATPase
MLGRLTLFGVPRLALGRRSLDFKPERRYSLLAYAAVAQAWIGRDQLAELFWPDREAGSARRNLRKLLFEVRELGIDELEESPAGIRWLVDTDLARFRRAIATGDWPSASRLAGQPLMLGLEHGHVSPSLRAWVEYQRAEAYTQVRAACLDAAERAGTADADAKEVAQACSRLLELDPFDEEVLVASMRLAQAQGRPEEANATYQRFAHRLADELGLEPSDRVRAAAGRPHHPDVAPAMTALVGRARETALAAAMLGLPDCRLITVIGPGGVGKTHLVRHLMSEMAGAFQSIWFVLLEDLRTPSELPGQLASRVCPGLSIHDDPIAALAQRWPRGPSLIVLDGMEHLVDAAQMLVRLLGLVPSLRMIVTSRERLDVDGEHLLPVHGLGAPDAAATADEVLDHPAVRLFVARARQVDPAFDAARHWIALRGICVATEGFPLALELAAAWVRLLPLADIERDLASGASLLSETVSSGRSMTASFDHSWSLLTPAERDAFARLAAFEGGFTRDASSQVAEVALPVLANLVDKSMLRADAKGRFDRHALLHEWARDKLAAQPDLARQMAQRHASWCLTHLRRHFGLQGGSHAAKREAIAVERANVLRAWETWLDARAGAELEAAAEVLAWFHVVEGRLPDGISLFGRAAQVLGADGSTTGALMLAQRSWLELWMEHHDVAEALARRAMPILDTAGHHGGAMLARRTLAHAARVQGRHAESARLLGQALKTMSRFGDARAVATLLDAAAMAWTMLGQYRRAQAKLHRALALNDLVGNEAQRMYNEFNLSRAVGYGGDLRSALGWADAAVRRAHDIGYRFFQPYALCQRAWARASTGDRDGATEDAIQALALADGIGGRPASAWALEMQARIALADGDHDAARGAIRKGAAFAIAAGNVLMGAPLVVVAARAAQDCGESELADRWLRQLLSCDHVQVPVQVEARALHRDPMPPVRAGVRVLDLLKDIAAHL